MKKILLLFFLNLFGVMGFAQTFTWNGSVSSAWNEPLNWTPNGIPNGTGITVNISDPLANYPVNLDIARTVGNLNVSVGTLNLQTLQLNGNNSNITGGNILNGTLQATNFTNLTNSIFTNLTLRKQGGSTNLASGGNTFNDVTFQHASGALFRLANSVGDTMNGTTTFERINNGNFQIAFNGNNLFNGNIVLIGTVGNTLSFGFGSGISVMSSGFSIDGVGLTAGNLTLNRFTQLGTAPNGTFSPSNMTLFQSIINGNVTVNLSGTILTIDSSSLSGHNELTASNFSISHSDFSSVSGQTIITKTGGSADTYQGGNTFRSLTFNLNSTQTTRFGNTYGDTFLGTTTFNRNGNGLFEIARSGTNTFSGDIVLNASTNQTISFGANGGTSTMAAGFAIKTTGFSTATLNASNFTQLGNTMNDTIYPTNAIFNNCNFGGSWAIFATGNCTASNSAFLRNIHLEGSQIIMPSANQFATISGTAVIIKNGSNNNLLFGGNVFGNLVAINRSAAVFRFANNVGDTCLTTSKFIKESSGILDIAFSGANEFNGNITLNNTALSNGIRIGAGGGTSVLSNVLGVLKTDSFANCLLSISGFTQVGNAANDYFEPLTLTITNSTFNGNFSATVTTNNQITLTNSQFNASNTFEFNNSTIGDCSFSATSGSTTFIKNLGSANYWVGGNTFNNCTINNLGTALIRLSNSSGGDVFNGTTTINKLNNGSIHISETGATLINGNLIINNATSSGEIRIGNSGTTVIAAGYALNTVDFANGRLILRNLTQSGTSPNSTFVLTEFTAVNCNIGGSISINSTGNITLTSSSFTDNANFAYNNLINSGNCSFSTISGNTSFTKNGGTNDSWASNNTFGNVSFTNNATNFFRLSNTLSGDTFTGTVQCNNNNTSSIQLAFNGTSTFAGNISLNNTDTLGEISIGGSGSASLAAGYSLITSGFNAGNLVFRNFSQLGITSNATFSPTNLTIENSAFGGNVGFNVANNTTINTSIFEQSIALSSGSITLSGANEFSLLGGNASLTKTGSGNNDWPNGQRFGNATITQAGLNRIRINEAEYNGNVTFTRTGSGTLEPAYNGVSNFLGDINTSLGTQEITFGAGTGEVNFVGNAPQIILTNPTIVPVFRRIALNTTDSVTLNGPIQLSVNLTLNNGILNTDNTNYFRVISTTAIIAPGSNASHINGPQEYLMATNSTSRSTLTFPIAADGSLRQIVLQVAHSVNTPYVYRANVFNSSAAGLGFTRPVTVNRISGVRYWQVERLNAFTMAPEPSAGVRTTSTNSPLISLYYDLDDDVTDPSFLTILKTNNSSPNEWFDIGGTGATISSGTITSTTTGPSAFNSFSLFTIGNLVGGTNPLPIQLLSFKAKVNNLNAVDLNWTTANEKNNEYFEIEKSENGVNWIFVGKVTGAGNSDTQIDYYLTDFTPFVGTSFYRLKQTDFNGEFTLSPIIKVFINNDGTNKMSVFPNPTKNEINLVGTFNTDIKQIQVRNAIGQLMPIPTPILQGENRIQIQTSNLPSGVYFITIQNENFKFIKVD